MANNFVKVGPRAEKATVKVRLTSVPNNEKKYWTGTVIGKLEHVSIVLTVAHPLRKEKNVLDRREELLEAIFFGSTEPVPCRIELYLPESEILVLLAEYEVKDIDHMKFAPKEEWELQHFQWLGCISHPLAREWRSSLGTVSCRQFTNKNYVPQYADDLLFFEHNLELVSGSSGAALLNENGNIVGIASGHLVHKYQFISGKPLLKYLGKKGLSALFGALKLKPNHVKNVEVLPASFKQAVHVKYVDEMLRNHIYSDKGFAEKTEGSVFTLNQLIERYLFYLHTRN